MKRKAETLTEVTTNNYCPHCSVFRYTAYHNDRGTFEHRMRYPYICPICRDPLRDPAEMGVLTLEEGLKVALLREELEDAERRVESLKQRIIDITGRAP